MNARGLIPWLASILVHAAVLAVPLGLLLAPAGGQEAPSVEISFSATPGSLAARQPGGTARQPGSTGAAVAGKGAVRADPAAPARAPGTPAFRTVPQLTGQSSTEETPEDAVSPGAASNGPQADAGAGQDGTGTSIAWGGSPRKVLHGVVPVFPAALSATGQEVEGEARITVSPSGAVIGVEITRSTGYIEVDASVEAALRDYLFSRVDSRVDAHGTVKFRFRLEKTD